MKDNLRGSNGTYKTEALFWETIQKKEVRDSCPYTSKEYDTDRPSLYRLYMESVDEYDFVQKHLGGSMAHWEKLCGLKWFREGREMVGHRGLNAWRKDMEMRDKSLARKILLDQAKAGNVTAAKEIVNSKPAEKRGRKANETKVNNSPVSAVEDFLNRKRV